jgi:sugar phosphate isomerase/epimerase
LQRKLVVSGIFISYRHTDGAGYAGRIFDRLQAEFGATRVYRDVDSIASGTNFPDEIARQLARCNVVLVVIGPAWCDARNAAGGRRLDDTDDWVRIEVAQALKRDICVIPVTVGGANLPDASALPEDLRDLIRRQSRELRDGDTWRGDLDLLVQQIAKEKLLGLGCSRCLACGNCRV